MSTVLRVEGGTPLNGPCAVAGDKSISHRAALIALLAKGTSRLRGFLEGADCLATLEAIAALGAKVEREGDGTYRIVGRGGALEAPSGPVDCASSGTTLRLLAGILAGRPFRSVLDGSKQLRRRPMGRVVGPLETMGATIRSKNGHAPLTFEAMDGATLEGLTYRPPVPSAQVKSCVLLAGLRASTPTTVVERVPTRDHTERLLARAGADLRTLGRTVQLNPTGRPLAPLDLDVPGDPSSAAFLAVAAAIVADSSIRIEAVGVNPTRSGIFDALREMGASIDEADARDVSGEPVADLAVETRTLKARTFGSPLVVRAIDELPLLALAATQAKGKSTIRDAAELRVKESNRIEATCEVLTAFGASATPTPDGMVIEGPTPLVGATVDSHGDHRLAMLAAVAGVAARGTTVVRNADVTDDSFPGFVEVLKSVGATIDRTPT